MNELIWIEKYYDEKIAISHIAKQLKRSRQTIYNVINFIKSEKSIIDYYDRYCENKKKCGAKKKVLSNSVIQHITEKLKLGWSPDVIIGRQEISIPVSRCTLYRRFSELTHLSAKALPAKGKRKPKGYQEKRGKQSFRLNIKQRENDYPEYHNEFGHLEGDTIVGKNHKSAVITLVERLSKLIIPLQIGGRKAENVENSLNNWLSFLPQHMIKSITFDCGKEFSKWRSVANSHDVHIYFADPGCPSQRALNENSNGLLRRDGLHKQMDFTDVIQEELNKVAMFRNAIPRKSLNYKTPIEVFLEHCQLLKHL